MKNTVFFVLCGLFALAVIALSLVWPQGLGSRSPEPFGKPIEEPDYKRVDRERAQRAEKKRLSAELKAKQKANSEQTSGQQPPIAE